MKCSFTIVGVGAGKGALHIGVDDALRGDLLLDVVVNDLGVVLCADAARLERSACGMPRRSNVFLMSSGTSLHLPRISVLGRTYVTILRMSNPPGTGPSWEWTPCCKCPAPSGGIHASSRIVLFFRDLLHDLCRQAELTSNAALTLSLMS